MSDAIWPRCRSLAKRSGMIFAARRHVLISQPLTIKGTSEEELLW